MNVTLQTNKFNSQYSYNANQNKQTKRNNLPLYSQPSFKGIEDLPAKSNLLNPFKRAFNAITSWIADKYTANLYTSKLAKFLSNHTEKLDSVVDHMQVMGSIIISGMYMTQTLRNKQLDEDRRRTLAVNQGLTFLLSTIGSYTIDRSLDTWWENITAKYAQGQTGDNQLIDKIKRMNDEIIKNAEQTHNTTWKNIPKKQRPKLVTTLSYIEENMPNTGLESKLRGMGVLKKLIVFGTVYRFLAPVVVTPFATMIGNKLANHKNNSTDKKATEVAKETAPKAEATNNQETKKVETKTK